jgi:pSer/pThr/pTyr-binding forkhead associated (FHA) protein
MAGLLLEVIEGPEAGTQIPLTGPVEAGRSSDASLTLDDSQVSRHHARIEPSGGAAVVADLGSMNGTYVNDQPIYRPRELRPGDRIRIGLSVLELRSPQQVERQPSAVIPVPPFAPVGADVLQPAPSSALPPLAQEGEAAGVPAGEAQPGDAYAALASLVDARVKRQTSVAVIAMLAAGGLAVLIFFGVR